MRHIFGVYEFRSHSRLFVVEAREVDQRIVASQFMRRGRAVTGPAEIAVVAGGNDCCPRARKERVNDLEIRDTVLIAAAFCMYNRHVDGLATFTPTDPGAYEAMGAMIAEHGYVR